MNCPLCEGDLSTDGRNKWILCSSNNHKYKLTDFDDQTRKSISLRLLSDSVVSVKSMLDDPQTKLSDEQRTHLEGQISAWQSMADYLRDDDFRDFEPE